jgi:hypothetical protein
MDDSGKRKCLIHRCTFGMTLSHIDSELERHVLGKLMRAWIHVQFQAFATGWGFLDDGIIIEQLEGGGNRCCSDNFSLRIDCFHMERPETPDWQKTELCFPGWVYSRLNLLPYMKSGNLLAVYGLFQFLLKDNSLVAVDHASFTYFNFLSDAHVLGYFLPFSVTLLTHQTNLSNNYIL